jgi:hypothetical protein
VAERLLVLGLDPTDVAQLPSECLPGLLAALAALQGAVAARLVAAPAPGRNGEAEPASNGHRWLSVREAAQMVGRDARWVYRRTGTAEWRPIVSKLGKTLCISETGLHALMERHRLENMD